MQRWKYLLDHGGHENSEEKPEPLPLASCKFQNSYQGTGGTGGSVPSIPQLGLLTDEACETGTASNAIATRNNQAIFLFIESPRVVWSCASCNTVKLIEEFEI